ncbi:hypothetical protein SAMN05518849_11091 [Sphingobium sp. AP50]|uniref:hypothetical protein n=1 Tax=Sphingobium sp. AP50 TaxID=1884369 RepID=UPI0008BA5354|nr:hypothetical protein [Sphingobium sp. AP50]SEJ64785.1 hypothetical protein SAMN05518849_11091 [Sphingobium sp. AP50]
MTGGNSTIVEFWRDDLNATGTQSQADDILLLKQAVLEIDESDETAGDGAEKTVKRVRIALSLLAALWLGFAGWAIIVSGDLAAAPSAWANAVATLAVPLILLALSYLLLVRNSRTESRRYLDTARALRTEADLLELRLGRITSQLESARQTMQDQAELLDSYGAAASSNMEASAELIAGRAHITAERAESAERAGQALVQRMDMLIASIPELEDRTGRMSARIMDDGHALAERIDMLEARLHALTEVSDEARARTLAATKSLSSQLTQLQESTRAATEEVTGMADIASGRIDATAQSAREAMDRSRQDLEEHAEALNAAIDAAQAGVASTSDQARATLAEDLDTINTTMRARIDTVLHTVRGAFATTDEGLSRRAEALETLVAAAQQGIGSTSEEALSTLSRDMAAIDDDLRRRLDSALERAQENLAVTDSGLTRQTEALDTLIARSRSSLDAIGGETVTSLSDMIADIESRLHHLDTMMEGQRSLMSGLHAGLHDTIASTEGRFAALEDNALARGERLTAALARLTEETQRIDGALASGGMTAEKLIGAAETLLVALDSSVRELDETYPGALERFDARVEQSRALLGSATPEIERLEAISQALVGRTEEAESLLRGQGSRLTEWLESTQSGLHANRELVDRLRTALEAADQDARRITEGAGPLLVTALLRVKDTADQAAERARQALGRAIPDAAQQLAQASDEALENVIGDRVTAQIEQVARVAEEAVQAAHQASERLTRQLLTIADTSASVEQRILDAEQAAEHRDRDHFARRSALLIESLNSTAIDVAKILSNDVTDSAWSAYLKGDRGVFTRRAVKLLDAGESREIALHYDNDADFRDHVNRYIHDFEAMLRIILSARDGNALGVAVLSSDMGKLYVALAQAIERLRQ